MSNAPWVADMQMQEEIRKEKAKQILFKEFRFYFDKDSFISYFCPPLAAVDFQASTSKAFNKQGLLEIPEESLTKQPKRYIQTSQVKFYALIDVYPEERYQKLEDEKKSDGENQSKEQATESDIPT